MMNNKSFLNRGWLIILTVSLLALALFVYWSGIEGESPPNAAVLPAPGLGNPDAPISVIEYADFQCMYCEMFAQETKPLLEKEFIETGLIRLEWRHFPIFGADSRRAALAATCAHEQGSFWEFHDALFGMHPSVKSGNKDLDSLVATAAAIGLDSDDFTACIVEERHAATVDAQFMEARNAGATGTPTFLVNGIPIVGAHPIETWREVVKALLKDNGS